MKRVLIKYGVGYGSHQTDLDFEDDATEAEINEAVEQEIMQRLEYSWRFEE